MKPIIARITIKRVPDENPDPSYLEQPEFEDRLAAYRRGEFSFIGIYAAAECHTPTGTGNGPKRIQTLRSAGLWGIEDDSSEEYLREIEEEELHQLKSHLRDYNVNVRGFESKIERH